MLGTIYTQAAATVTSMDEPDLSTAAGRLKWARTEANFKSIRSAAKSRGWNENTYKAHEQGVNNFNAEDAKQ